MRARRTRASTPSLSSLVLDPVQRSCPNSRKWKLSFEWRVRPESRTATNFGKDPGIDTVLNRMRLGLAYKPVKWLKISGMAQDSRATTW